MSLFEGIAAVPRTIASPTAVPVRDRVGYAAVFAEHRDAVVRLAFVLCGNLHSAEDVAAEAFARVWPHWKAGRVADDRTYLRKAVLNEVRSRWRRRALERREEQRLRVAPPAAPDVESGTHHDDIVRALASLPANQRAVVALRFLEDLSEAETARLLGLRVGTVKSQTSRALKRLRAELNEEEW